MNERVLKKFLGIAIILAFAGLVSIFAGDTPRMMDFIVLACVLVSGWDR